ncbi:NUDIX hydrolase [Phycicoccus endophyticus]|uniref:NUDIX hydrolase n=1 Tax=Phycicoccus endophyticus TaxID=1690220 RepID=A0A7G9R1U9_9MICO|nr:NUDIX hydrolase [Phycicoccus endophyticus]NHI18628.1 NUDIX hydrolase [Phycicoccus endophyticus]QNN49574.1 NUDIX hydrolase [Phycicoccus endophyticus]GGL37705.1 ADP-ribose pyrophosphatase [Phycicoccus endophyticus]
MPTTIPAAGTIPWRVAGATLEVALVHRPRYDDWSWPKGKLDPGEDWAAAATRETHEETGLTVRLGLPLPEARYTLLDRDGTPSDKVVRYWAARVTGGSGRLVNEIDDVAWLSHREAHDRLDYARDRDQLLALVRHHQAGTLDTWPLVVVRHAQAVPRSAWDGHDDTRRPLTRAGRERAGALVPVLAAYAPERVVSSPSVRCLETVAPFAGVAGMRVRERESLAEEGFADDPSRAPARLQRMLERARPAVLCTHGPVLPALLDVLRPLLEDAGAPERERFERSAATKLVKGEALVCHVAGAGPTARVVAVERHLP